jgi:multicomponent Na+:H+ antiporter subunit D
MVVVSALTGGALLRVGVRVFLGRGLPAPEDPHSAGAERGERGAEESLATIPALLWGPAVALIAGALAWGLIPGVVDAAGRAAARFTDTSAYADLVLHGRPLPPVASSLHGSTVTGWLYAAASVAGAIGVALAALGGARERAPRAAVRLLEGLRGLHSGRPGDYAAFTAAGVAALGALLALTVG